jgi:hypothetical protein
MKTRAASSRQPSVRLVVSVLLLATVAFACGKKEERPRVTTQPASPTPVAAATGTPAPPVSAAARLPATAPPTRPLTTDAAPPPPPPPTAATSEPAPTAPAERRAVPQPAAPAGPAVQRPKGKISLPAKLGAVSFDHERHASEPGTACTTCHHASRPQKPLVSENQACRDCHTMPAVPPMKTSLQAAFHDPKGAAGTCIDCHKKRGGSAPVKCLECHKKKS